VWALSPTPRMKPLTQHLWRTAEHLVQAAAAMPSRGRRNCSDLNQALMEFGALVCTARNPQCDSCPLTDLCAARAQGDPTRYPRAARRSPTTRLSVQVWILDWQGRGYLEQQAQKEWNAGLWQFPTEVGVDRTSENRRSAGRPLGSGQPLFSLRHTITRHRIQAQVFYLRGALARRAAPKSRAGRWHRWADISHLALSSLHRKVYERWASGRA
jgi:A/G-specific adenine glycosylase